MKLVPDSAEPDALAMRLMARLVSDWSSHIDWEDVPELVEESWEQVGAEMDEIAVWMLKRADEFDREYHVDSRFLYEQATTPADRGPES